VDGLRGHTPPKKPQKGEGLIVLGSIAFALGGAFTIATLGVGANCIANVSQYGYSYMCPLTIPLALVAGGGLSSGIPLLVGGLRKRKAYRARKEPAMSAFVVPGREGVAAGFGIRF
jgi:hypothetical protein